MKMTKVLDRGYEIVTLTGCLDIESVAEMKSEFDSLTANTQSDVVLDMTGVTFMDSSGVGALVFTYKRLKAKQLALNLVGLSRQPQKLVRLLRIDQSIPCHALLSDLFSAAGTAPQEA